MVCNCCYKNRDNIKTTYIGRSIVNKQAYRWYNCHCGTTYAKKGHSYMSTRSPLVIQQIKDKFISQASLEDKYPRIEYYLRNNDLIFTCNECGQLEDTELREVSEKYSKQLCPKCYKYYIAMGYERVENE